MDITKLSIVELQVMAYKIGKVLDVNNKNLMAIENQIALKTKAEQDRDLEEKKKEQKKSKKTREKGDK